MFCLVILIWGSTPLCLVAVTPQSAMAAADYFVTMVFDGNRFNRPQDGLYRLQALDWAPWRRLSFR